MEEHQRTHMSSHLELVAKTNRSLTSQLSSLVSTVKELQEQVAQNREFTWKLKDHELEAKICQLFEEDRSRSQSLSSSASSGTAEHNHLSHSGLGHRSQHSSNSHSGHCHARSQQVAHSSQQVANSSSKVNNVDLNHPTTTTTTISITTTAIAIAFTMFARPYRHR